MSKPLNRVAVIGTGTLGTQIALLAAHSGYQVKIYDVREGAFKETLETLRPDLQAKGKEPFVPWDRWDVCQAAIREITDLGEAVKEAELVVEAVLEDLELKRQVFAELGRKAPPEAILVTNSSSMPVSRLEESSGRPEKCLNIHFYMIMAGMNMADVMGGTCTSPEVLEKGIAWVRSLGCISLTVKKELLGFCFNRVWRAIKREALYMWSNGFVDFRDVDRGWMVFTGMEAGPFALMDKVGLDVIYDIEMVYYRDSNDPKDKPPDALLRMIERGNLGVKSGKGFYTYPDPEFTRPDFMINTSEALPQTDEVVST